MEATTCRENQSLPDHTIFPDLYHRCLLVLRNSNGLRLDLVPSDLFPSKPIASNGANMAAFSCKNGKKAMNHLGSDTRAA